MPASSVALYSTRGYITYTPPVATEINQEWRFPDPPCRPLRRRPHSIQITRWPVGFVPHELRPQLPPIQRRNPPRRSIEAANLASRENAKRVLDSVLAPFSSSSTASSSIPTAASPQRTPPAPIQDPASGGSAAASMHQRMSIPAAVASGNSEMTRPSLDGRGMQIAERSSRNRASSAASTTSITEQEKPVASGGGISCFISLAEPTTFLTGLGHDGNGETHNHSQSMVRGKFQMKITKSVKIKAVSLKFMGKARTEWPEGIPPTKVETFEEESLRNQTIPFFNSQFAGSENGYGALCNYTLRPGSTNSSVTNLSNMSATNLGSNGSASQSTFSIPMLGSRGKTGTGLTSKEAKRLSLQNIQARSFQKGDSPFGPTPAQRGFKTFHPGVYEYPFELSIDNNSPETTKLPSGSVKWTLESLVERSGTFKSNLIGTKEVLVVRSPSEDSLELVEPISISRKWEDQLHYDIIISGKAFPLGSKIPIAFKLTPLAKVQVHKLKVYVSENVEYFTNDKKVARRDTNGQGRKILLLEKCAGKSLAKEYQQSEVRVLAGGELDPESRIRARAQAQRIRSLTGDTTPLPEASDNLLGDIDLGLDHFNAATEIEMQVQLPTCEMMEKDPSKRMTHDCTWKNVNVHHWIKIVMRISRKDSDDPEAKRRHFEISIDSPFTVLNCRATRDNLALPEYSGPNTNSFSRQHICGCPNAAVTNTTPTASSEAVPTLSSMNLQEPDRAETFTPLALPPQAHLHGSPDGGVQRPHEAQPQPSQPSNQRPMYMMRHPSYNPPAFDEEEPPPPLATPPPQYDHIIGTPSHDGLADYFARLGEAYDDDDDDVDERRATTNGRVNIANPRTPGGRLARSMDIDRNFMFNSGGFARFNREGSDIAQANG